MILTYIPNEEGYSLKNKMKRTIIALLAVICIFGCTACGSKASEGVLTDDAAARAEETNPSKVYIDDEAIAMAGSLSESDRALIQAAQDEFNQINSLRTAAGLSALSWSNDLAEAAYVRSQEIVGTFSHTRPDGSAWYTVNSNVMYGENLAKNFADATSVTNAWMNSSVHKAVIMTAGYKTLGVAIYKGSDGNLYWAQEYGY